MSKTIVNLTLPVVIEEAEDVLDSYPYHPYQQAFSIPDLRKKLISYVLCRVPGVYTVVEEDDQAMMNPKSLCNSLEQRIQIENLIRQGIEHILRENMDWVDRHIPQETNPAFAPSNWFG
ncbi:MAG: late competence development ComFB family protein [Leptolyngbyaceae cyanobacterium RM2_2_4]|nr:late competence development ComFB family protein [Leptolyngbyaceae cyanobacterium SM1_4_3]NJN90478.1 late competence development ComFB family protein [Leptolyngbyaceae cyanobacterium SL_5_14]NJO49728.1 late competence development ComFB family protein [Leptolyngbyaceae cyanobacterium RM2_2_4]